MSTSTTTDPLSDLVGCELDYQASPERTRHGTIARVEYSLSGEPAVTIHLATRPSQMVLFGHLACELVSLAQCGSGVVQDEPTREPGGTWRLVG